MCYGIRCGWGAKESLGYSWGPLHVFSPKRSSIHSLNDNRAESKGAETSKRVYSVTCVTCKHVPSASWGPHMWHRGTNGHPSAPKGTLCHETGSNSCSSSKASTWDCTGTFPGVSDQHRDSLVPLEILTETQHKRPHHPGKAQRFSPLGDDAPEQRRSLLPRLSI